MDCSSQEHLSDMIDFNVSRSDHTIHQPSYHRPPLATSRENVALDEEYDTSHTRRGMAIVINNENFQLMNKREGSRIDRDTAFAVLTDMKFDVRVYNDLTCTQLFCELDLLAGEDHSESDCLLVMIMTHGDENVLYASDAPYRADVLWEKFLGNACPTLLGKPKLFFVQACRGAAFDKGVKLGCGDLEGDNHGNALRYTIPTTADLLVMYSSYEGHVSMRNPTGGSWFIQALCVELQINGGSMELLQLLTGVSRRVAYDYQSKISGMEKSGLMKQMPSIVSMLTKLVYFPLKK